MPSTQYIRDLYRFPGFVPLARVQVYGRDPEAVLLTLRRRRKKRPAVYVGKASPRSMTKGHAMSATWLLAIDESTCPSPYAGWLVGAVAA